MKRLGTICLGLLILVGLLSIGSAVAAPVEATSSPVSVTTSCQLNANGEYQMGVTKRTCRGGVAFALIRFNSASFWTVQHYQACLNEYQPKIKGHGSRIIYHNCVSGQVADPGVIYANKITTKGPGPTTYVLTFLDPKTNTKFGTVTITKP